MKEYLEIQLKKKVHELVMLAYRALGRVQGHKGTVMSLRKTISKIPIFVFEGQASDFDEDKIKHFSGARNNLFEAKYYLDIIYKHRAISYYSYRQMDSRLNLIDKIIVSRIQAIDKRKARAQYKISIREKYI